MALLLGVAAVLVNKAIADSSNGMDMSMDGAMPLAAGNMLPYFHFTPGDNLWFQGWVPSSAGSMVGACIGLFLLGISERWIACIRSLFESSWRKRAHVDYTNWLNSSGGKRADRSVLATITLRNAPPFIAAYDLPRGVLYGASAALGFLFMLAIMTFQVGFILSILAGLAVGETLFGRFIHTATM